MRKIAANYIFLPHYPLVKQGYVVLEEGKVKEVVDTQGMFREIQGLEFYGGMIVAPVILKQMNRWVTGEAVLPFLAACYRDADYDGVGLAILKGADLKQMVFRNESCVEKLI